MRIPLGPRLGRIAPVGPLAHASKRELHAKGYSVLAPRFERAARTFALDLATPLLRMGGLEIADWDAINETRKGGG